MTNDIDNLVSELQLELDLLERVFSLNSSKHESSTASRLSIFEQAEIECDKEELQDKLNALIAQSEGFDQQISSLQATIMDLKRKNDGLEDENVNLRNKLSNATYQAISEKEGFERALYTDNDYKALEYKFAETRSKLARIQQAQDDQLLAKEILEKEIDIERSKRLLAEKERLVPCLLRLHLHGHASDNLTIIYPCRDAYIAAYEASLKHFEKWSKTKILRK
jgi:regulator of replication initiation timing